MSLFEYAQEVVSRKLEREKPMLSVSMGMQPVMPMAQGGGLSSVQNSLNINGQPHRLAYINPNEEDLLKSLGGSGRNVDGIPAYDSSSDDADSEDSGTTGGNAEGTADDSDPDSGDTTGQGFGTPGPGPGPGSNPDTFDMQSIPDLDFDPQNPDFIPYHTPPEVFAQRSKDNLGPNKSFEFNPLATLIGLITNPVIGKGVDALGIGPTFDISIPGTATPGGYGDTGTFGNSPDADADADAGTADSGGDIIIREKIAAVRQVPVEEVTVAEVQRAKRLTAAQRVTGTRLEDILDDIYGSGKGAGLLGITTNNTGTA